MKRAFLGDLFARLMNVFAVSRPNSQKEFFMISQFFEIQVKEGGADQYLDIAASLKPRLEAMGGCLFIDRFKSMTRENCLLSYQVWQDEGSMVAWRVEASHHKAQQTGRKSIFSDYRIRIAQVLHEARPNGSTWQPERISPYNDPSRRRPTYVLATESKAAVLPAAVEWTAHPFKSVYRDEQYVHLLDVPDTQSGLDLGPRCFAEQTIEYFRLFEVMRDYGMYDRTEAPQYYPPVDR